MGIWSWSKTAGSNTTLESVSAAEGMDPGLVNNLIRAIAAGLAAWRDDTGGQLTAGGTADALTLTTNGTIATLADGQRVSFVAASSNTGAATVNVDSRGALAIRKVTAFSTNDVALDANDIRANGHYTIEYDASANSAAGAWILLNPSNSVLAAATFTPTITFATPGTLSVTYATQTGRYIRIGNLVFVSIKLSFTPTLGTASGSFRITGLPFAAVSDDMPIPLATTNQRFDWTAGFTQLVASTASTQTYLLLSQLGDAVTSANLGVSAFTTGVQHTIALAGMYECA